ncbi:hypothetical protein AB870_08885 [Pandoraea faecigallinarum]|uniref:Uncharacterized protein n=1 Tax=Pandoraea faecigallinarum TaxID=656179 RepID=A0A0H3WUC8_9BURK|nr:hypothetical protein AB870_08885 [Pandoraea faecigallinarum]
MSAGCNNPSTLSVWAGAEAEAGDDAVASAAYRDALYVVTAKARALAAWMALGRCIVFLLSLSDVVFSLRSTSQS